MTGNLSWAEVARLPLVLLAPDMRMRQVMDGAFADSGLVVDPQIETDSAASMHAYVDTGMWASIVPHTWLRAASSERTHIIDLVDPTPRAQIVVATNGGSPGSPIARAFATSTVGSSLDNLFDQLVPPARSSG